MFTKLFIRISDHHYHYVVDHCHETCVNEFILSTTLTLSLQNYKPACQLLQMFGSIEVTVEFLTEIDKLVQLIESPIFTFLRLQLLDPNHNFYLIRALYGILMLLPQVGRIGIVWLVRVPNLTERAKDSEKSQVN